MLTWQCCADGDANWLGDSEDEGSCILVKDEPGGDEGQGLPGPSAVEDSGAGPSVDLTAADLQPYVKLPGVLPLVRARPGSQSGGLRQMLFQPLVS